METFTHLHAKYQQYARRERGKEIAIKPKRKYYSFVKKSWLSDENGEREREIVIVLWLCALTVRSSTHTNCTVIHCRELLSLPPRVSPSVYTVRISSIVHVASAVQFSKSPKTGFIQFVNTKYCIHFTFASGVQCCMQQPACICTYNKYVKRAAPLYLSNCSQKFARTRWWNNCAWKYLQI